MLLSWHNFFFTEKCFFCFSTTLNRNREEHNISAFQASKGMFPISSYAKVFCSIQGIQTAFFSSSCFFRDNILYQSFSSQMTHLKSAAENRFNLTEETLAYSWQKVRIQAPVPVQTTIRPWLIFMFWLVTISSNNWCCLGATSDTTIPS